MSELSPQDEPLDTIAMVESPEHVRFDYHVAGPARRALAYIIDAIARGVIVSILVVIAALAGFAGSAIDDVLGGASIGLLLLVLFVLEWGYFVFFEVLFNGRSPGKKALGIRVVTSTGQPLHMVDSILRNLLRAADLLPKSYAFGLMLMAGDKRFRRFGDLVAGTIVVVENRHVVAGPLQIDPPPRLDELQWFPERLPLSGDDLDAIELLLRRGRRLSPMRAYELAEIVAPIYAKRLGFNRVPDPVRFLQLLYYRGRGVRLAERQFSQGDFTVRRR